MAPAAAHSEAFVRSARMLRTALGSAIAAYLEEPAIVEVMLNPDGRLWVDRLSGGLEDTGATPTPAHGERIVRLVAAHHAGAPCVSAEFPKTGEWFEGLPPPVVAAPAFAIRKPTVAVFTLEDYVAAGIIMTAGQAQPTHRSQRTGTSVSVRRSAVRVMAEGLGERGDQRPADALSIRSGSPRPPPSSPSTRCRDRTAGGKAHRGQRRRGARRGLAPPDRRPD